MTTATADSIRLLCLHGTPFRPHRRVGLRDGGHEVGNGRLMPVTYPDGHDGLFACQGGRRAERSDRSKPDPVECAARGIAPHLLATRAA